MAIIFENYLVSRNVRGKVQVVHTVCEQNTTSFEIKRFTGQLGGKISTQPVITITSGKVKRTPIQQAELEYKSKVKGYLDKGYVKIEDLTTIPYEKLKESEINELLSNDKSDANGIPKPMLAVSSDKVAANVFEKDHYCSRKLDGVRNAFFWKDNEIHSASRGGGEYDVPTTKLRNNPKLIEWFKQNPNIILDGELYSHGVSLQKLSGIARLKEWDDRCDILEYWIYDMYLQEDFEDRYEKLMELQEIFDENDKINVIDHYKLSGYLKIKKLHDKFVKEGYEGLVMRNPDKPYGVGKRSSVLMVKLKDYQDDTFIVTGWEPGLRPVEDMCFILTTKTGKEFKAKPMGSREIREEYVANIEKLIGQKADVKYFSYSDDGIPMQPIFKAFRYDI